MAENDAAPAAQSETFFSKLINACGGDVHFGRTETSDGKVATTYSFSLRKTGPSPFETIAAQVGASVRFCGLMLRAEEFGEMYASFEFEKTPTPDQLTRLESLLREAIESNGGGA